MGAPALPPLSASQVSLYLACPAKWVAVYIDGEREPETPAQAKGKAVHKELEEWTLLGKLPTDRVALAGLPHAPAPGTAHVERPVLFSTRSTPWRGYVDSEYALEQGRRSLSIMQADHVEIQDWKTTSKAENAKTVETLLEDTQVNLYGYEAFVELKARHVSGKWVYLPTNGTPRAIPVLFDLERSRVVDFVEGTLDPVGAEVQQLYQLRPKMNEVRKNTGYCYAYKKQCHVYDRCKPNRTLSMAMSGGLMSDFKATIEKNFPGAGEQPAKKAPPLPPAAPRPAPPLPAKKAPPLPAKRPVDIDAKWEVHAQVLRSDSDRTFVNPPEAPGVPSRSPEEEAERQGRSSVEAPVEVTMSVNVSGVATDAYDTMSRDQLRALAVSAGLVPDNTKARESGLRKILRDHDARVTQVPLASDSGPSVGGDGLDGTASMTEVETTKKRFAEKIAGAAWTTTVNDGTIVAACTEPDDAIEGASFTLYINCAPQGLQDDTHVLLSDIVVEANKRLEVSHSASDYRLIQYTGAAELCLAVRTMAEEGWFDDVSYVVMDSRTVEGGVLCETMISLASTVVRGF